MTYETLKQKAKNLPALPGVYLMKDQDDFIIYVGKSKHLKNRVSSYFGSLKHERQKVKQMVAAIHNFEVIFTDTELDALLLECQLIKTYKPLYNRLLKNDKKYRYLYVDRNNPIGGVSATFRKEKEGLYFGPFDKTSNLLTAVEALQRFYKLPSCKQSEPLIDCLPYRLGRCLGACEVKNQPIHQEALNTAIHFLQGNDQEPILYYEKAMHQASENLDFEQALMNRQYLFALKSLHYRQEAVALSLSQKRGVFLLPVPTGGYKLYCLKGTTIFHTCLLTLVNHEAFLAQLMDACKQHLNKPFTPRTHLEKHEMDASLITYSYLMTHNTVYYEIHSSAQIKSICRKLITAYSK